MNEEREAREDAQRMMSRGEDASRDHTLRALRVVGGHFSGPNQYDDAADRLLGLPARLRESST